MSCLTMIKSRRKKKGWKASLNFMLSSLVGGGIDEDEFVRYKSKRRICFDCN